MGLKHSDHVLGHNDREQLRLIRQARILAPVTESLAPARTYSVSILWTYFRNATPRFAVMHNGLL
jgi:hypothetical protein